MSERYPWTLRAARSVADQRLIELDAQPERLGTGLGVRAACRGAGVRPGTLVPVEDGDRHQELEADHVDVPLVVVLGLDADRQIGPDVAVGPVHRAIGRLRRLLRGDAPGMELQ